MIIGITGSFGSGKTTVSLMFKRYGFKIINADKIYHNNFYKNKQLKNKIKKEFGTLDRTKLKNIVFNDHKKLQKLNEITHPIIIKEIRSKIKKLKNNKIVVDVPLLFEAKLDNMFDKIVVVKCDKKELIKRILKKNKYSKKEIMQIIKYQMSLKEKIKKADIIISNDKALRETELQIKDIIKSDLS